MKTAGIICEYNPFHKGHALHIEKTRMALGEDTAVVGVMSGNFVQRGDFAILSKTARAEMAIRNGVDLVIELPVSHVLQSAEGFANAGVYLLDKLGVCDCISFGSETGDINVLREAATALMSDTADMITKEWLDKGIAYAAAQQKAADVLLGNRSKILKSPNNVLGIEYIKALLRYNSKLEPLTVKREGGEHDGDSGYSASAIRKSINAGDLPSTLMPDSASEICKNELLQGRGPVTIKKAEQAILSRLRFIDDYSCIPGVSEGLDRRFEKYAGKEESVDMILAKIKTKRYTMSRLRRILMCAVLGIKKEHIKTPPLYAKVLAMNKTGMELLKRARKKAKLPVITKPAAIHKYKGPAVEMFRLEAAATDFYTLAYPGEVNRAGGGEWLQSPVIVR